MRGSSSSATRSFSFPTCKERSLSDGNLIDGINDRREGTTLIITLVNPDRRNSFTIAMRRRINALLDEAYSDEGVRVIILRGEGAHFCAGADLTGVGGGE